MGADQNKNNCACGTAPSTELDTSIRQTDESDAILTKFLVAGMDCNDEVNAIKNILSHPGIQSVSPNIMAATVEIRHLPSLSKDFLKSKIESVGVKVSDALDPKPHAIDQTRLRLVAASGALLVTGFWFEFFLKSDTGALVAFTISTLLGGKLVFPKAWRAARQRELDMNVLMTVAVVGAFFVKEYSEAATVVFLFSLSELLEAYSVARARLAIREVLNLTPPKALKILSDGSKVQVSVADLKLGDIVLVKTGDRIPVDGEVIRGHSTVNQAPLTGESVPVEKRAGDKVFAGTINETGILEVKTLSEFNSSKVSQIIRLVEDAQKTKAPSERFVDSFARIYTPVVFLIALGVFVFPPLFLGADWNEWFYRALVLLVIACPCALVISTPVSIVSGLTAMAKKGVLVKGGVFLEALGKVTAIAVDKTGTITEGKPEVQNVLALNKIKEDAIIEVAGSIESLSSHPLAEAIVNYAKQKNLPLKHATDFKTVVGKGAEAEIDGHEYFLGNHRFAHELGICSPELESILLKLEAEAQSVVVVGHRPHHGCAGEVLGVIALGDTIRANTKNAIAALHEAGVKKIIMLSGDNQRTASAIAMQAGIDEAIGDLLPEDKVARIKALTAEYKSVAMIGDGINDAPALAQSTVGIAMGGVGTDTAIETADVTLMQDDLVQVSKAIHMGKRALSVIRFNIGFAISTKLIFLVLAVLGVSSLWLAVLADTGASLLVTANALRLLKTD